MLPDNGLCDKQAHFKVQVRTTAGICHVKLFLNVQQLFLREAGVCIYYRDLQTSFIARH